VPKKPGNSTPRVTVTRQRMREQGLRPIQIWVPDTRSKKFAAEARRQSLLLRDDPQEKEIMAWIEEVSDTEGWV
jgi:hypothetical protein